MREPNNDAAYKQTQLNNQYTIVASITKKATKKEEKNDQK